MVQCSGCHGSGFPEKYLSKPQPNSGQPCLPAIKRRNIKGHRSALKVAIDPLQEDLSSPEVFLPPAVTLPEL